MWKTSVLARQIVSIQQLSRLASTTMTPKLYAIHYDYVSNALEKRAPHRQGHLAHINKQVNNGNVILGGALDNPPSGALILLRNLSVEQVEQFVREDPYFTGGVVTKYTIKPFMAVVGDTKLKEDLIKI